MKKRSIQKGYEFLINGKPTSLLEIAEKSGDDRVWRSFLEKHGRSRNISASLDRYLKDNLGEYLSSREITVLTGIRNSILDKWRKRGVLRASQIKGKWYYSIESLVSAIKSADIRDLTSS